jgi:four helix bundle protein
VHRPRHQQITGPHDAEDLEKESLAKLGIVVEELDESDHWLAMLRDSGVKEPPQNLITECSELRAILAKSCATGRRRQRPPKKPDG